MRWMLTDQPFPLFEGSGFHERSFPYAGDLVTSLAAAFTRPEPYLDELINLGMSSYVTPAEAIRIVEAM